MNCIVRSDKFSRHACPGINMLRRNLGVCRFSITAYVIMASQPRLRRDVPCGKGYWLSWHLCPFPFSFSSKQSWERTEVMNTMNIDYETLGINSSLTHQSLNDSGSMQTPFRITAYHICGLPGCNAVRQELRQNAACIALFVVVVPPLVKNNSRFCCSLGQPARSSLC